MMMARTITVRIPFPEAPIFWLARLIMDLVVVIQNLENEFVLHNPLHHNPYKFGAGNSAFFCCLLEILNLQRNHDVLDGHNISQGDASGAYPRYAMPAGILTSLAIPSAGQAVKLPIRSTAFSVSSRPGQCLSPISMRGFIGSPFVILGKCLELTRNSWVGHGLGCAEQSLRCF